MGRGLEPFAVPVALPGRRPTRGEDAGDRDEGVRGGWDGAAAAGEGGGPGGRGPRAGRRLACCGSAGCGPLPVCMAKTQYSLSDDANLKGRPSGFTVTIRDI